MALSLLALAAVAAAPATRPATGPTTAAVDPYSPLANARKPKFTVELDEARRLARLGIPNRHYLATAYAAHAAEWRAIGGEDDASIDVLMGLCASEGIGAPADAAEALRRFDLGARLGSAPAMVRLGTAYATGAGVEPDPGEATVLYRHAAQAGDVDGMTALAAATTTGAGVTQDDVEAVRLYRAASDAGDPDGDIGLATAYRLGRGVKASAEQSRASMRRATDAKSTVAMLIMGDGCAHGSMGQAQDLQVAVDWYRKAADAGNADAMLRLSDLCLSDPAVSTNPNGATTRPTVGGAPDPSGAVAWIRRAAATGEPAALLREGDLFALGLPPTVKVDGPGALALYRRSVAAGGTAALGRLGYAAQIGWHTDRDPVAARDLYSRGAGGGDADCMAALASTYAEEFKGLEHDPDTEAFWYQRAASAGNVAGMLGLGACYLNGTGVQKDPALAARWYGQAADAGSPAGMNGLGLVYSVEGGKGFGSDRNPTEAASWFREAAQRGDGSGMRNLARSYTDGVGVPADPHKAIALFQVSIRTFQAQGDSRHAAEVMLDLARLYAAGPRGTQDPQQAVAWANRAATAGEPAAWTFLGDLSQAGTGGVRRDREAALVAYRKGALAGDVPAMLATGSLRQQGVGGGVDEREAFAWYTRAAAAGSAEAMDRLGLLYWKGTQAAHNLPVAVDWFGQAADAGSALGAGHLAEMRARGFGGPPDMAAASRYARQAAEGGHPEFLTIVGEAYLHGAVGRAPDRTSGVVFLRMAAAAGDPAARAMLQNLPATPQAATQPVAPALHDRGS